jgi:hypothetical protein
MGRVFHPALNTLSRVGIYGTILLLGAAGVAPYAVESSPYATNQDVTIEQPVPFSHKHHAKELGIDCRYCHTSVTQSAFAGIPPTKTCMTCHSQIWTNADLLEPIRKSWETGVGIAWTRVDALPRYVYFDHSIHVNKGVGCATCHGRVQEMPLMRQAQPLTMGWCLDCHREPEQYLRPRDEVFNMNNVQPADQLSLGRKLYETYHVRSKQALMDCSTCHR